MREKSHPTIHRLPLKYPAMATAQLLLYAWTMTMLALTPGPAVFCIMSQSARFGPRAALAGNLGIQTGHIVLFPLVGLGLAAVLKANPMGFTILRYVGAAYLAWLGLGIIRAARLRTADPVAAAHQSGIPRDFLRLYTQAVGVQLTNPKEWLFVTALLPPFLNADLPLPPQLGTLLLITFAIEGAILFSYSMLAHAGASLFKGKKSLWLERGYGAGLILCATALALTDLRSPQ